MRREILLLALLSGCASTVPVTEPNPAVAVPIAQPMTLASVHWQVMTADQLRALANKLQAAQGQHAVVVLDSPNYDNLSLNLIEIERYIREQKVILDMLQAVIAERAKLTTQDK